MDIITTVWSIYIAYLFITVEQMHKSSSQDEEARAVADALWAEETATLRRRADNGDQHARRILDAEDHARERKIRKKEFIARREMESRAREARERLREERKARHRKARLHNDA